MIELRMVHGMLKKGALLAPFVILPFFVWGGFSPGISAAIGLVMALGNLYLGARIIGGIAEANPKLLLAAGMVAFAVGLVLLTAVAFGLQAIDVVIFKVTGLVLVGTHLVLVLWEAAGAYPVRNISTGNDALKARS